MIDVVMISEIIKIDTGQIMETGDSIDKIEDINYRGKNYRGGNFRDNTRTYQNFERKNSRGEYRNNYRDKGYGRIRDRNRSRVRSFSRNFSNRRNDRSTSNSRSRSGLRLGHLNLQKVRMMPPHFGLSALTQVDR